MIFKKIILFFLLTLNIDFFVFSQQTIKNFYLSNWQKEGKRWELKGKEALIRGDYIDIKNMQATYFLKERTITLDSERGRIVKPDMNIFLKNNVNLKTDDGITLRSSSLSWQKKRFLSTFDKVRLKKDNMRVEAKGLLADTDLGKINFKKDVKVNLADENEKIIITCQGPLEINYNQNKAVFNKNVVVVSSQGKITSDKGIIYFDKDRKKIVKIICEGNVKIEKENNITFAQKATYIEKNKRIILEGSPRLIIFPEK